MKNPLLKSLLACLLACGAGPASAATLTWSGNGTTAGGAGTWNTTTLRWSATGAAPFDQMWDNAVNNDAVFGGTGGAVTVGAAVTVRGTMSINSASYSTAGSSTLTFATGSSLSAPSGISATLGAPYAGTITKTGAGTIALNNASGAVTKFIVNAGTLTAAAPSRFGSGADSAGFITFNGGTFSFNTTTAWTMGKQITVNAGGGTITSGSGAITVTYDKAIAGTGNFTNSVMIFQHGVPHTFTGRLFVPSGTTRLTASDVFADAMDLTVNGGTFNLNGFSDTIADVTVASGTLSGTASTLTASTVSVSGGTLSAANVDSDTLTVSGGTVSSGNVIADAYAVQGGTISGVLGGSGTLTKTGTGTATITGINTYSGDTIINNGGLSINGTAMLGTGVLKLAGGTLLITANRTAANTLNNSGIELSADSTLQSDVGSGTRLMRLDGPLSRTAGTLTIKNGAVGGAFDAVLHGGNYQYDGPVVIGASGDSGSAQLSIFNVDAAPVTFSGVISGYGTLRRSGSGGTGGDLTLSGDNTYSGGTVLNDGSLNLALDSTGSPVTSGPIGTGTLTISGGNGALAAVNGPRVIGNDVVLNSNFAVGGGNDLTLTGGIDLGNGARTWVVTNTGVTTLAGVVTGAAVAPLNNLMKNGDGVLVVTNANTYTGNTAVNEGKLVVSNTSGSATGSGDVTVATAGTLAGAGIISGAVTVSGTIAPGASPGVMTTGSETWNGGGKYKWEINDTTGTAGADPGWDLLNINGTLTIASTDVSPFVIDITSLTTGNVAGPVSNFDGSQGYTWTIAEATGGIVGFAAEKFQVLTDNFANSLVDGQFIVEQDGNKIVLSFVLGDPPAIATAPESQTVAAGGSVTFSVEVTGTAPFTYQWRKGGVSISGATDSTYTINPVAGTDAGSYSVRVFNAFGFATSTDAVLSVAPGISSQPAGGTVAVNGSHTFTVVADGEPTLTYQWKKDGADLDGATLASYTIDPVRGVHAGSYGVRVSNGAGFADSTIVVLDVPPDILAHPQDVLSTGGTINLSVTATGTAPLSYTWRKNTEALSNDAKFSGVDTATLQITGAGEADSGSYDVVVSNSAGSSNSTPAVVTVETAPIITAQPASLTVNAGQTAEFSVTVSGAEPITYVWKKDGNTVTDGGRISGATTTTLSIANAEQGDAGSYTLTATNADGEDVSDPASLTVIDPPVITAQPAAQHVGAGSNAVFTVSFTGTSPSIQWQKNGSDISGATDATLTLNGVTQADGGSYAVVLSNAADVVTSDAVALTVYDAPVVTTHPATQTRPTAGSVTFTVAVTGTSPSYQWKKDGVDLANDERVSGATTASLTIDNLSAADDGNYSVAISNIAGDATGGPATLTVIDGVSITAPPQSLTVNSGDNASFSVTATGGGTVAYQWQKNGVDISGATLTSLDLTSVSLGDAGEYTVVVSNEANSISASATLTVDQAPTITVQPESQTANFVGANVTFSVTAVGHPLNYQWRFNGNPIANATDATYVIPSVQSSHIGYYSVVVSNSLGSDTSANADLSLVAYFADKLDSDTSANWQTNSQGNNRMTWAYDYSAISIPQAPGATNTRALRMEANLSGNTISAVNASPAGRSFIGDYQLRFNVWLNVLGPFPLGGAGSTEHFTAGVGTTGDKVQFIEAGSQANGVWVAADGDGQASATYKYPDFGIYTNFALVNTNSGAYAGGTSGDSMDHVRAYYTSRFAGQAAPVGQLASWSSQRGTLANGTIGMGWHEVIVSKSNNVVAWTIDGHLIASVTNVTLAGDNVFIGYLDGFTSVVPAASNVLSCALFANVKVEPLGAHLAGSPVIAVHPQSGAFNAGTPLVLNVEATGAGLLRYQWQKGGINLPGATSATLVINDALASDAGTYRVLVFNDLDYVTSSDAVVTVADPAINTQPQSQTVSAFQSVTFDVGAAGTGTLQYQWKKGGIDIDGETSSSLTIDPVHVADAGTYSVSVTGDLGTVLSQDAVLTVNKAAQTITFDSLENKTYGDGPVVLTASASSGLTVDYSVSGPASVLAGELTITGAGTVIVTASQAGDDDHEAAASVEQSFSVAKALLTVTADDKSRAYGAVNPSLTAGYTVFVNGENLATSGVTGAPELATPANAGSSVGDYAITVTEGTLASANYSFATVPGTLTVTQAALTATADNKSRAYGDANPALTVSYTGFVNDEDATVLSGSAEITTTATVTSGVGNFPITVAAGTLSAANYAVTTFVNGTLTVTAAPLSLVVDDKVKLQGTANPEFTGTITGIRNSDGITASYSTTATESSPVGTYAITGSLNGNLSNYDPTITHGELSIFEGVAITQQPIGQTVDQGANVTLSVEATGGDLGYQWKLNGVDIAGATESDYTIESAQPADAGTYTVLVTNPAGSLLSDAAVLSITLDPTAPKLVVIAPKPNFIYTNVSSVMLTGTVFDAVHVASVQYDLNGAGFELATVSHFADGKPSNWVATATMAAGTNTVIVRALDRAGNAVTNKAITFFYHVPSTFTYAVTKEGVSDATITPLISAWGTPSNGAQLNVGRTYKIKAQVLPGTNSIITNITYTAAGGDSGVLFTNTAVLPTVLLNFTMKTNMHIDFNTRQNPLNVFGGAYYGLFSDKTNGVAHHSAGYAQIKVTSKFTYSAKLIIDGNTIGFGGKLPIDGKVIDTLVLRTKQAEKGALKISFDVDMTGEDKITGSISEATNTWVSSLEADRMVWTTNNTAKTWTNAYTAIVPGFTNKADGPVGSSYGNLSVDLKGKAKWIGGAGDYEVKGSPVVGVTYLSKDGFWPFYAPMYKAKRALTRLNAMGQPVVISEYKGAMLGWLQLTTNSLGNLRPEGEVSWIKTGLTNILYSGGFTNLDVPVIASRWLAPTVVGQYPLSSTTTNWNLTFTEGNLLSPYVAPTLLYTNKVVAVKDLVNKPAAALAIKTGLMKGTFLHPSDSTTVSKWFGVALQDLNIGEGWFVGPGEGGKMEFAPAAP